MLPDTVSKRLYYENKLSKDEDVNGFRMEGQGVVSFPKGRMRLESALEEESQNANIVFWCPIDFPANFVAEWDFWPIREPGLAIMFFSAMGANGEDLFDPKLAARSGPYSMYHHGDINAYHVSYFRRARPSERAFQTCHLRKSYGFHLVCEGADPISSVTSGIPPYHIKLVKYDHQISFHINHLEIFKYLDDGHTYGPVWGMGKMGFRQMAPLIAEYANFKVFDLSVRSLPPYDTLYSLDDIPMR
jgi:hypothetical protein